MEFFFEVFIIEDVFEGLFMEEIVSVKDGIEVLFVLIIFFFFVGEIVDVRIGCNGDVVILVMVVLFGVFGNVFCLISFV